MPKNRDFKRKKWEKLVRKNVDKYSKMWITMWITLSNVDKLAKINLFMVFLRRKGEKNDNF